ncbi:MAG: NAD(P)H-hydrate dehydratase [Nitrospira sp.]|nr:NAD(P)H-hydrate dehydratase [Nitrospira sp.]
MKVVTSSEMREIDRKTIQEHGIDGLVLMERAGMAVVARIKEVFGRKKVIVVSGSGNNGGDGLVVARNLHNEGWDVKAFLTAKPEDLKGDALSQYTSAVKFGVDIKPVKELLNKPSLITAHTIIVDALLGTGLSKKVTGTIAQVISFLNNSKVPIVSVDIPSGISSDTGQIMGEAIKAGVTVTFGLPKRGHLLFPGAEYSGKLFIEDIGFPKSLLDSEELGVELLTREDIGPLIPERRRYSHKGDYGHVLIVAGSRGKTGAALMAAKACLKSGAGLVTIGIPESLGKVFQSRVTEEMTLMLPDRGDGTLAEEAVKTILGFLGETADVLAIGPGIGVSDDTKEIIKTLIEHSGNPLVIDADGINCLKGEKKILKRAEMPVILTPHPGEMARLIDDPSIGIREIEKDRITTASTFARELNTHLVLKGVPSLIVAPDGKTYINSTGNPGMATAGTGDVLTGMIAGFLSQKLSALNAAILGVYLHGLAGDLAVSEKGEYSLVASDIIEKIPAALRASKRDG